MFVLLALNLGAMERYSFNLLLSFEFILFNILSDIEFISLLAAEVVNLALDLFLLLF